MERVRTIDSAWLYVESPSTPMHVGGIQIFSMPRGAGSGYVRDLVAAARVVPEVASPFSLRLHRFALSAAFPLWEEVPHPDLHYHVFHHALPPPGGDRELQELVARLQSEELDMERPLWECHVIEGLERHRFAMFTKFHHSLIDGVAGMRLLQSGLSTDPRARGLPAPWGVAPRLDREPPVEHTHAAASSSLRRLLHLASAQARAIPSLYRMLRAFRKVAREPGSSALTAPYTAPRTILNAKVSRHHRVATVDLPLARIVRMARVAGVTVNDVFLALCAAALRRYLWERGALPAKPLVAGLPVSVRPAGDTTVGTLVTFVLSTLATDIEDPIDRLATIHRATTAAKTELQKLERGALTEYTLLVMGAYGIRLATGLGALGTPVFNVTVSNVRGPPETLYYNGARLEAIYPTSIITHGQALNITVISYAGRLNVGFTACDVAVPHVESLTQWLLDACDELDAKLKARHRPAVRRKTNAVRRAAESAPPASRRPHSRAKPR